MDYLWFSKWVRGMADKSGLSVDISKKQGMYVAVFSNGSRIEVSLENNRVKYYKG